MYFKTLAIIIGFYLSISFPSHSQTLSTFSQDTLYQDTLIVQGKILDSESKNAVKATVSYERIPTRDDIDVISSDSASGEYKLLLKTASKYKITIHSPNYITAYFLLEDGNSTTLNELKEVMLVPLKVGQVIVMNRITFERGKAKLQKQSFSELDNVQKMLSENPKMEIQLEGHTDNAGSAKANLKLSEDRVNSVREYLVQKGIKKSRVEIKAFGGSKPVESNVTEEGRIKNRRVEIRILRN